MMNSISVKKTHGLLGIIILFMLLPCEVRAQREPTWGVVTNGLRLGSTIYLQDSFKKSQPPECVLHIQNVSMNKMVLRFPPVEHRYEMELRDPNGQQVQLMTEKLIEATNSRRHPVSLQTNEIDQIGYFFITDLFKVQTNGIHTLIISEYVTTNYVRGKEPVYFLLPPVTSTFNILPKQVGK